MVQALNVSKANEIKPKSTMPQLANSYAIQVVFSYLTEKENCKMQQLCRRFYYKLLPGLIKEISLYVKGNVSSGLIVFPTR